jgi:hypothetical protein
MATLLYDAGSRLGMFGTFRRRRSVRLNRLIIVGRREVDLNWEAVGAVGEMLAAATVVATLFYLARQVKHATAVARSAARQAISQMNVDFSFLVGPNRTASEFWTQASVAYSPRFVKEVERVLMQTEPEK